LLLYSAWLYLVNVPHVWDVMSWNDFGRFWYALQEWYVDGRLYEPTVATWIQFEERGAHYWNLNPPHFHLLLLPLSHLSTPAAFAVWMLAQVVAGWASWRMIRRVVDARPAPWLWAFVAVSEPVFSWMTTGQLSGFVMLFGTAIWLSRRQQHERKLGLWVGVASSIKPFLGVFLLDLVIRRQWRAVAWALGSSVVLYGLGIAVFGLSSYVQWIGVLRDVRWAGAVMNASLAAIPARTIAVHALVTDPIALTIGTLLGTIVLVAGLVGAYRADPDRATLILGATSLLASPLGWIYYVWLGLGPFLVVRQNSLEVKRASIFLLGWLVPHFALWPFTSPLFAFTVGSLYSWVLLAIWVASLRATVWNAARDRLRRSAPGLTA
jgi:hypothetical protein